MDVATRLELIETRNELTDLISRYAQGFDERMPEVLREIFHEDAIYEMGIFGHYEGRDAIMAFADETWVNAPHMHHWMSSLLFDIDLEAGTATSSSWLDCYATFVETGTQHVGGRYDDVFVRVDGRWWIKERTFDVQFVTPLPDWKPAQGNEAEAPAAA